MKTSDILKEFKIKPETGGSFAGVPLMEFSKEELIGILDWTERQRQFAVNQHRGDMEILTAPIKSSNKGFIHWLLTGK